MSFTQSTFNRVTSSANGNAPIWYAYKNTDDTKATIIGSGYFNDKITQLAVGDICHVQGSDDYGIYRITSVTTNVTVEAFEVADIEDNSIVTAQLKKTDSIFSYSGAWKATASARPASDYAYFHQIDAGDHMTGGDAQKTYILGISGDRQAGSVATGDSNDAIIKGSYSNYAACDSNFIIRALNTSVTNRSGGTLGTIEGCSFGTKNQGTAPTLRGMTVRGENYGTNASEFGVLDVNCSDEVGAATLRYGLRVRNTDASAVAAMGSAVLVSSTATNGFDNALTLSGKVDTFADFDAVTGNACTESGTAATTWKARIKVVSPDGTDCYVNCYSTSNV